MALGSIWVSGQSAGLLPDIQNTKAVQPYKLCWDYRFDPAPFRSVAASGNTVFIAEAGGRIRAISSLSNQTLWLSELGGNIVSMFVDPQFGLYIASVTTSKIGNSKTTLRRLDPDSGLAEFSVELVENRGNFLGISAYRLIVSDNEGHVASLDAASGTPIWDTKTNGRIVTKPAYGETTVAVATDEKKIEFLGLHDGKRDASILTKRDITSIAFRANQMIVVGDDRGNVTNYRDRSGSIWWQFKSGGRVGTIAETEDGILVGSFDNFLYMISKYSGDVKWKRRLEGRIVHLPAIRNNELAATISTESDAVVINSDDGKLLEQISLGSRLFPVADPVFAEGSLLVVPVSTGLVAFSRNGCK